MHFVNHAKDEALRAILVANEVVNDRDLADMVSRVRSESGHLYEDVLIPYAEEIDSAAWLYWLVSRHRLLRLNAPRVTAEFVEAEGFDGNACERFCLWQTYPVGRTANQKSLIVAVGRPDYLDDAIPHFGPTPLLLAATPLEVRAIFSVYRSFS
jgi:hypothetical protein